MSYDKKEYIDYFVEDLDFDEIETVEDSEDEDRVQIEEHIEEAAILTNKLKSMAEEMCIPIFENLTTLSMLNFIKRVR